MSECKKTCTPKSISSRTVFTDTHFPHPIFSGTCTFFRHSRKTALYSAGTFSHTRTFFPTPLKTCSILGMAWISLTVLPDSCLSGRLSSILHVFFWSSDLVRGHIHSRWARPSLFLTTAKIYFLVDADFAERVLSTSEILFFIEADGRKWLINCEHYSNSWGTRRKRWRSTGIYFRLSSTSLTNWRPIFHSRTAAGAFSEALICEAACYTATKCNHQANISVTLENVGTGVISNRRRPVRVRWLIWPRSYSRITYW